MYTVTYIFMCEIMLLSSATKKTIRGWKAQHFLNKYDFAIVCLRDLLLEENYKAGKLCRLAPT